MTLKNFFRKGKTIYYDCLCDCGVTKIVRKSDILSGSTKSCGCLSKDRAKLLNKKYNKWRFEGDIAVGLTNNNMEFCIDLKDYEKCKDICWFENYDNHTNSYYIYGTQNKQRFSIHQFILGKREGFVIDHIDHDTTNNRRSNLRVVTLSNNAMNQRIKSNNTSGVKGVRWHKATQKWQSGIGIKGKQIYLGVYETFDEAVKVRKEAEKKYFGEYSFENSISKAKENAIV